MNEESQTTWKPRRHLSVHHATWLRSKMATDLIMIIIVIMTMPVFSGVCRSVSESDLIALIPTQLAHRLAPALGLSVYRPPMPVDPALIEMMWHKRSTATPEHRWLRELIAEILLPLNEGNPALPG